MQQNEQDYKRYRNKLNHLIRIAKKAITARDLVKLEMTQNQHEIQSMIYLAERSLVTLYRELF